MKIVAETVMKFTVECTWGPGGKVSNIQAVYSSEPISELELHRVLQKDSMRPLEQIKILKVEAL